MRVLPCRGRFVDAARREANGRSCSRDSRPARELFTKGAKPSASRRQAVTTRKRQQEARVLSVHLSWTERVRVRVRGGRPRAAKPFIPTRASRESKMKVSDRSRTNTESYECSRDVRTAFIGLYVHDCFFDGTHLLIILANNIYSDWHVCCLPSRALSPMGSQCQ